MRGLIPFLYVGAGGCVGSLMRYGLALLFQGASYSLPFGTLLSNILGSFLIGAVTGLAADVPFLSSEARLFLATGVCGGFTTLSSMIYELAQYGRGGQLFTGGLYLVVTLAGAGLAFFLGLLFTRMVFQK